MGGVVFFDEIGDASLAIQAKLLAYMDDYQVTPRGWSGESLFCPMLVVAATNRPIDDWSVDSEKEDHERRFRNDLFRRFNFVIRIPSLNERKEQELAYILDVLMQMEAFNPERKIKEIGAGALQWLQNFDFDKGNFRDLETMLRRACRRAVGDGRGYLVESDVL
jgi:DNA-binding NtrC family response regulator